MFSPDDFDTTAAEATESAVILSGARAIRQSMEDLSRGNE
jgi:hypothetical protein